MFVVGSVEGGVSVHDWVQIVLVLEFGSVKRTVGG